MAITKLAMGKMHIHKDTAATFTPVLDIAQGPCTLEGVQVTEPNTETVAILFYDDVNPTLGTTEPTEVWFVPKAGDEYVDLGGVEFDTALSYAVVEATNFTATPAANLTLRIHITKP